MLKKESCISAGRMDKSASLPRLSIIIPAYNEEKRISPMLQDYCNYFSHFPKGDVEIIVVLNGCRDNTLEIVKNFSKKYPFLSWHNFPEAIGKGGAIIEGFKKAKGEFIGFADADGATSAQHFYKLMNTIESTRDVDGVIASRWIRGAIVEPRQGLMRRIASRTFNLLGKILFGLKYYDTQCGCKLFRSSAVRTVTPLLGVTQWAFDVDLLYQMKMNGLTIQEIPTVWRDKTGSQLNVPRVSREMFLALVRLRLMYSPFSKLVTLYNKTADLFRSIL